jgi:hypothetical protein
MTYLSFPNQNVILAQIQIQQFQVNADPGICNSGKKEMLRIVGLHPIGPENRGCPAFLQEPNSYHNDPVRDPAVIIECGSRFKFGF